MNKKTRTHIKQAVIETLSSFNKPLELPVPIKKITKSKKNVRLIPYSTHMARFNLSYSEMLSFAGTEDAFTDYYHDADLYVIYYNDVKQQLISTNRYRWNIAHELGHVVLQHHKKHEESKLYRSSLSKAVYDTLEAEANLFAAYILVPHIVLLTCRIQNKSDIADICHISGRASDVRYDHFNVWRRRKRCEPYDLEMLTFFSLHVESKPLNKRAQVWLNQLRRCRHCGALVSLSHDYCKICGNPSNIEYRLEDHPMKYPGIELDEQGRALTCPICNNTELAGDGAFCMICGTEVVNRCLTASDIFSDECSHDEKLPGNARYCPHCGGITSFYKEGYITAWKEIHPRIVQLPPQPIYDRDDDLPF